MVEIALYCQRAGIFSGGKHRLETNFSNEALKRKLKTSKKYSAITFFCMNGSIG